jgi:hypothetical protein
MLNRKPSPVATLFILLTLTAISEPAKAFSNAQKSEATSSNFLELAQEADKNTDTNFKEQDSGSVNPDLEDSGQINFDPENSGEINSDFKEQNSGSVNPDLEDSGSVNPDLEDSGQTLSLKNSRLYSQASPDVNNDAIAPNEIEEATDEGSSWWWWLPLIIGIPLIAAILVSTLGGKRSDREPALGNVRDPNAPDGGIGLSGTSAVEDLSTVGANASTLSNTVTGATTSNRLSGAALASGTALADGTSNLVGDTNKTDEDINLDLDLDRDNLTETESATEIPSNSVSEFTGQETKLQISDRGTRLQGDIEDISLETLDNTRPNSKVSELAPEQEVKEFEETVTHTQDIDNTDSFESQANSSDDTDDRSLEELTSSSILEADTAIETDEAKEFRGDFVLEEETQTFIPDEQVADNIIQSGPESLEIQNTEPTADNLNLDVSTTSPDISISESESSLSEIDAVPNAVIQQQTVDAETIDEERTQIDSDITNDDQFDELQELNDSVIVSEAASNNFSDNDEIVSIDEIGFDDADGSDQRSEIISDFRENNIDNEIETIDASLDEISFNYDVETIDTSVDEIGFDDTDNLDLGNISFDDEVKIIDANLDEISFDDTDDLNLDDISFDDEVKTDGVKIIDANLDEISFDDVDNDDSDLDSISFNETSDSNLDEIILEESDKTQDNLTLDLLSSNTAKISDLADDESNDMDNISEWLNSLETPNQNTDNILEWLDKLNTDDTNIVKEDSDRENDSSIDETNDVSFQFIEDLLERDDSDLDNR